MTVLQGDITMRLNYNIDDVDEWNEILKRAQEEEDRKNALKKKAEMEMKQLESMARKGVYEKKKKAKNEWLALREKGLENIRNTDLYNLVINNKGAFSGMGHPLTMMDKLDGKDINKDRKAWILALDNRLGINNINNASNEDQRLYYEYFPGSTKYTWGKCQKRLWELRILDKLGIQKKDLTKQQKTDIESLPYPNQKYNRRGKEENRIAKYENSIMDIVKSTNNVKEDDAMKIKDTNDVYNNETYPGIDWLEEGPQVASDMTYSDPNEWTDKAVIPESDVNLTPNAIGNDETYKANFNEPQSAVFETPEMAKSWTDVAFDWKNGKPTVLDYDVAADVIDTNDNGVVEESEKEPLKEMLPESEIEEISETPQTQEQIKTDTPEEKSYQDYTNELLDRKEAERQKERDFKREMTESTNNVRQNSLDFQRDKLEARQKEKEEDRNFKREMADKYSSPKRSIKDITEPFETKVGQNLIDTIIKGI